MVFHSGVSGSGAGIFNSYRCLCIGIFRVVLGDIAFNAGSIEYQQIGQRLIHLPANWLGQVHKPLEDIANMIAKILLEPYELRSVGHLVKSAVIAHFVAEP